ncbi:sensor histidine kinase [Duganella aceris]|uniref:histidine kinase n=1 Tax=Duganella aceris TaxID=2703883 RepID=A0ABX0FK55_9BURK|nr:HAMP domain-containing sensor histidine kinase [Duganella aceris]NGZ84908.1 HAMP domain-containing histidine kinase [Duganella aceris]
MLETDQINGEDGLSSTSIKVLEMREAVFEAWEKEVRALIKNAQEILPPVLINTLPVFYDNIAEAMTPDHPRARATSNTDIAAAHGNERARMTSYSAEQIIHEYQLFRDVFFRIAEERGIPLSGEERAVVIRSIDSAVRESVQKFTSMHDTFRHRVAASLSHDMRNPLSVVVSAAQLLTMAPHSEKAPIFARKILDNGRRLGAMIEELLEALSFNKGQKLPLVLTRFDIMELARKVCDEANDTENAGCTVEGESVIGYWCENSMRRALENLVTNAVKYGDGGGIDVKIEEAHERMMLSVHNSGTAIPMEHRGRIFEYLRREGGNQDGWGIGLPFVQSVAESHGGSIALDSSPATGTTFLIDVPVDCRPFVGADHEPVPGAGDANRPG